MVNYCVSCGDIIPEGTHICYACAHDGICCPDCGANVRLMSSCRSVTPKQILYSRLYHCETCEADWEADNSADEYTTKLKRKIWG